MIKRIKRKDIVYTGEFVVPGKTPYGTYQAHINRYVFARRFVKDKDIVLDAGCGAGYGLSYLADTATSVVGLDISSSAISYAKSKYIKKKGLNFVYGDMVNLPFVKGSFDIVVSFETIEHLKNTEEFLFECRSVLRTGGLFICSTPNKRVTSPYTKKPTNPFHVKEFTHKQFSFLLYSYFSEVSLYGQYGVNLIKRRPVQIISEFLSAIPGRQRIKTVLNALNKIYCQKGNIFFPIEKGIKEEILDRRFGVTNFEHSLLYPQRYLIAVAK